MESIDNIENYKPTGKNIIFKFTQDIASGVFNNKTAWGLEVRNQIEDVKTPRWGTVIAVGPNVPERVKKGTFILIEQLMWTEGFKVNDVKHWATHMDKLLAYSDEEPTDIF